MIVLNGVTHAPGNGAKLLSDVSIEIPTDKPIVLVGKSEPDKKELLYLLSGATPPQRGRIKRHVSVAFPTGMLSAFDQELSLRENLEYVARLYDVEPRKLVDELRPALALGSGFDRPMMYLPRDVRMLITHIVPLSLSFDVYMIHALVRASEKKLNDLAQQISERRMRSSGVIVGTRDIRVALEYCRLALVCIDGRLLLMDDIVRAFRLAKAGRATIKDEDADAREEAEAREAAESARAFDL